MVLALQHLLAPASVTLKNKKRFRPTIEKSKNWLLKLVDDKTMIDGYLALSTKERQNRKLETYPVIFGIGESTSSICDEFVLRFKNISYTFDTIIEALDAVFKCYVVFNINFSPEHKRFWALLNGLFYKIECKLEITSSILSIVKSFES